VAETQNLETELSLGRHIDHTTPLRTKTDNNFIKMLNNNL